MARRTITPAQEAALDALRREGVRLTQIHEYLEDLVEVRRAELYQWMDRAELEGLPQTEVAEVTGYTREHVRRTNEETAHQLDKGRTVRRWFRERRSEAFLKRRRNAARYREEHPQFAVPEHMVESEATAVDDDNALAS